MKIRLHYNRTGALNGKPWTLHTSKGCMLASHVRILCPVETEERPLKRSNPRYFLVCDGTVRWRGSVATISSVDPID
jgi:hypothetical protein